MARVFLLSCIAVTLSVPTFAAAQSAPAQPNTPPQAEAGEVLVDVVVTDPQRHPIHNLQASDFTLLESGRPQTIHAFEEHHAWDAAAPLPQGPSLPAGAFSNLTIAPVHGALNILLLDLLNTPVAARAELRNRMVRYLEQVHPGTHIGVLGLTNRLILLQGLTSDPQLLSSVLKAKDDAPAAPAAASNAEPDDSAADAPQTSLGNLPSAVQVQAGLRQFLADLPAENFQQRARATLDALNQIGRSLGRLPGRKNLIWFSGSYPLNILPNGEQPTPFAAVAAAEDEFRQTASLLSRSQVAVYPIEAAIHAVAPAASGPNPNAKYIRPPVSHSNNPADLYQLTAEEPGTLQAMADATGGQTIPLTDELKDAVESAVDRGANYYTLAYTSNNPPPKGAYRTIKVTLNKPEFALAYRHAYFADNPYAAPSPTDAIVDQIVGQPPPSARRPETNNSLKAAMALAAPVPTEIILSANVAPLSAGPANSPFRRYSVQLGVSAKDIVCPADSDGAHTCTLDLSIFAYDAAGASISLAGNAIQARIPASQFEITQQSGLSFRQDFSLPLATAVFLRIGVRDQATDKVGVIELPLAGISSLPSATPLAPPQPSAGPAGDQRPPHPPEQ